MGIAIFAQMRIAATDQPVFERVLAEHLAGTYAEEPGCLALNVHRDSKDPGLLLVYELYRDADAMSAHKRTPRLAKFRAATESMMRDGRIAYVETAPCDAARRPVLPPDGPIAIFVDCRVEHRDTFDPAMAAHIAATQRSEPGCLAFDWSWNPRRRDHVQLYELYASKDALAVHRASAQLKSFRAQTGPLMLDARIHYAELAWHAPLDRLLARHGA